MKKLFFTIFILFALTFGFSGIILTAASEPTPEPVSYEAEVYEEELIADEPVSYDSDPGTMHDITEVGMPELPAWELIIIQWEKEGYPDDIGGFYYDNTTNVYGVLVVNPSQRRINELLVMFDNSVVITPCLFSYNELRQVQNEITEMMISNPDSGIYSCGIGWTSADGIAFGFGESGKEFRVTVHVDKDAFYHYHTGLTDRYGERVYVDISSPITADDLDGGIMPGGGGSVDSGVTIIPVDISGTFIGNVGNTGSSTGSNLYLWVITATVLLCAIVLFIRFRLMPAPTKQTVNGNIVTPGAALTGKQIIAAIKNSGSEPEDDLFPAILKRIDNV